MSPSVTEIKQVACLQSGLNRRRLSMEKVSSFTPSKESSQTPGRLDSEQPSRRASAAGISRPHGSLKSRASLMSQPSSESVFPDVSVEELSFWICWTLLG